MLASLLSIVGILLTIIFVVGSHEAAHFLMARWVGVKVLRFSIGFGKALVRFKDKSGCEYVFALIPLGGYVKMLDEGEEPVAPADLPRAYNHQPFYKKFLIIAAGPLSNILCAFLLYWLIFVVGFVTITPTIGAISPDSIAAKSGLKPNQEIVSIDNKPTLSWMSILFRLIAHAGDQDILKMTTKPLGGVATESHLLDINNWHINNLTPDPLGSLGIIPYQPIIPLVIGVIGEDSPAATSALKLGDKIIAVNQQPVSDWDAFITIVLAHPDATLTFTLDRNHQRLTLPVAIGSKRNLLFQKSGYLGVAPQFEWPKTLLHTVKFGPFEAFSHAAQQISDFTYFNLLLFGKLITGKLSLQSLGGPITVFQGAGSAINGGFLPFIGFLAFLSISIGIINLLPIPGLDGGHLFILIIEFIIQRPLPVNVINILYRCGFFLIIFFIFQAIANDLLRIF